MLPQRLQNELNEHRDLSSFYTKLAPKVRKSGMLVNYSHIDTSFEKFKFLTP